MTEFSDRMWRKERKLIDIWISPVIVKRKDTKEQVVVDWVAPEGITHWLLKVAAVKMLLMDGFTRGEIFIEFPMNIRGKFLRADVFGQRRLPSGVLKTVWFECGDTDTAKMRRIQRVIKNCQIVRIIDVDWLKSVWFEEEGGPSIDDFLIPYSEVWASTLGDRPRLVFGIRRLENEYVFLEGEWSVRSQLELRKKDKVEPLTL